MYASVNWMNDYVDPPATADEQAELLTRAGFPLEGREPVNGSDVRQDFEMISNRGDCVCHVGLAREIAAMSGRTLNLPRSDPEAGGPAAKDRVRLDNREPGRCPLYTARVITGVKVRPSPPWLADRLRAIGQIPRNAIVDASNFVLFELGQPTHVFDLAKLGGPAIIVRMAEPGEPFLPIGEATVEVMLTGDDLVIADETRAVAIAGVKGGAETAVTDATTDILIEAATFDRVSVRNTSRRLNIASDSSYRFERGVHPAGVDAAAKRLAGLILDLCGGELCTGVLSAGAPIPKPASVTMRTERARKLLGVPITDQQMVEALRRLGFEPKRARGVIRCTVPIHRLDVEREVDLIEEVGRVFGQDNLPVTDTIRIRVAPAQPTEEARRAVNNALSGMGYLETLTHSLVSEEAARLFLLPGRELLRVDDERARAEPVLRPSLLPSLLRVRAFNADNGVEDVKLFESASTFWRADRSHSEEVMLALVSDVDDSGAGLRPVRGVIGRLVEIVLGASARLELTPDDSAPWLAPGSGALVGAGGETIGRLGVVAAAVAQRFGLEHPILAAELDLPRFYDRYPPDTEARPLPSLPAIERDISAIVGEKVTWAQLREVVEALELEFLEAIEFVTTFRGKPVPRDHKSVTFRLRFRAPDRTLQHDQVDPQVQAVVTAIETRLGGEIRKQAHP